MPTYYQKNHLPSGTTTYNLKHPECITTIQNSDGSVTTHYPDGTEITRNLDQTIIKKFTDNTEITHYPDGSTEYEPGQDND